MNHASYNGLIASIPATWKMILIQRTSGARQLVRFQSIPNGMKLSKHFYWKRVQNMFDIKKKEATHALWERDLDVVITEELWEKIQFIPNELTSTKLRFFQYRIVNRKLTTNIKTAKWNTQLSTYCSFCNAFQEIVRHLPYDCHKVKAIWRVLQIWLSRKHISVGTFSCESVAFCNYTGANASLVNIMLFIFKQYIYAQNCKHRQPTFIGALANVVDFQK